MPFFEVFIIPLIIHSKFAPSLTHLGSLSVPFSSRGLPVLMFTVLLVPVW